VKSSCHSLPHFWVWFCDCQVRWFDSIQFQAHIPAVWRLEAQPFTSHSTTLLLLLLLLLKRPSLSLYNPSARTPRKTSCIVKGACLLVRYQASPIVACACVFGMCLPSRCLAMGIKVTICFGLKTGEYVRYFNPYFRPYWMFIVGVTTSSIPQETLQSPVIWHFAQNMERLTSRLLLCLSVP
jgi:hypothetical protein